jgi:hypothetical protein
MMIDGPVLVEQIDYEAAWIACENGEGIEGQVDAALVGVRKAKVEERWIDDDAARHAAFEGYELPGQRRFVTEWEPVEGKE